MNPNRSYLIVGASGTIGSAVARQLATPETRLGLHYCTNVARASALKSQIGSANVSCELMPSCLDSEAACRDLIEAFAGNGGQIDGLALCAGTINWANWRELTDDHWQRVLFEHCLAPFYLARHAATRMDQPRGGRIVFLSSISPKYGGSAKTLHYAAAKAALETAMRGLARELGRSGIRVNGVRAGFVDSPQHRQGRSAGEIAERIRQIPVGRAGTPEEVASAFVYLLSEQASFVNGELITVAGGD
jgi:NAD(P)-dependent dehydrogenase (short-subunit alcohol dehydrogenase family)